MNRVPLRPLRSLRLTRAPTAAATRPTKKRCPSGRPDPAPRPRLTAPPPRQPSAPRAARPARPRTPADHAPGRPTSPGPAAASPGSPSRAPRQQVPEPPEQAPQRPPERAPGAPGRPSVRCGHGRPGAAGRRVAAARPAAAARGPAYGPAAGVHVLPAGRRPVLPRSAPAARPLARFPHQTTAAGRRPLVAGRGHRGGRGRLRRLADRRADPAGHRPRRPGRLPADRLLDRAPRLAAHPVLTRGLRRHAPRPDLRQRQLLPGRLGPGPGRHGRNPLGPGRRDLARRRLGRAGHHAADRRVRGPVVRRPGRPAGRRPVGARRGRRPRAEPARAVHQPRHVQRAAGPGPAVRRPVPADRRAAGHPSAAPRSRPLGPRARQVPATGPARTACSPPWPAWSSALPCWSASTA